MPAEDMAADMGATAVGMVGTASNMPRPVMLRADTAPFVFAVGVAANLSGLRAAAGVMQGADITELAAVGWGGYYGYPYYGYSRYSLGYYGLGYGYPYYGYYGYRSGSDYDPYYGYYPWGYYPYRYGYWPSVNFSFGFSGY